MLGSSSGWTSLSQWHRWHITPHASFAAFFYATQRLRRRELTRVLTHSMLTALPAEQRVYLDTNSVGLICDYLQMEEIGWGSNETDE